MNFNHLLFENKRFQLINKKVSKENIKINGLSGSSLAYFIGSLKQENNNSTVIFLPENYQLQILYEDLLRLVDSERLLIYPDEEILPHEQLMPDLVTLKDKSQVMVDLLYGKKNKIILTTPAAVMRKMPPVEVYQEKTIHLKIGEEVVLKDLFDNLFQLGYSKEQMVEEPGQYSVRGGIVDIYTLLKEKPFRIEFFGDEIDSIRLIDPATQRSVADIEDLIIPPYANLIFGENEIEKALPKIEKDYRQAVINLRKANLLDEAEYLRKKGSEMEEKLREFQRFAGCEQFLPYFYEQTASFFDYLDNSTHYFIVRPDKIVYQAESFCNNISDNLSTLLEQGIVLPSYINNFFTDQEFILDLKKKKTVLFVSEFDEKDYFKSEEIYNFNAKGIEPYHSQLDLFARRIEELIKQDYKIIVSLNTSAKKRRISSFLKDKGLPVADKINNNSKLLVLPNSFSEGFIWHDIKLAVFSENEVLGNPQRKKRKIGDFSDGIKISSVNDLQPGNYVVHENHGIGKYLGVETLEIQKQHKDYLVIKYAGEDKLYVPTDQVDLVQKYVGADGKAPRLYKLGGSEWQKVKQRVENSVKEMAIGLLELYASRETLSGYSFSEDTIWQKEFETAFPYEETPDQKQAIEDVKADMEDDKPMDRLLCGDVGYGKTEVAIRAAFKAAVEGKQTAVLVPTTILAQQHFNTFNERIDDFPVNVEMISRFKTPAEQRKILKKVTAGKVDIIIGTHRLLSKDVLFHDLGLLVIDEEQRFGVTHKERIKDMKRNVDVLTLTATPIPRTLHMALVGVRDMSVIETPPANRYPIRTFIKENNKELIADALRRELGRDGQIYFVHNRVADIDKVADKINKLVPEAKIAVAHGQMNEHKLEKLMYKFYNKHFDVLVCTTIIETGLDIPNVNTIVINSADKMGLSQLYQLRGRVGRTNKIAYAYLLYERDRILPEVAEKRLMAIKEFTSLGSGFKIAMRDLEIRGAGNLLGAEQSGHIAAVGFSLYTKLLEATIEELKGKEKEQIKEVEIDLNIDAYIPDDYISDSSQKIEVYKRIKDIKNEEDTTDIIDELIDRFGDLPDAVLKLVEIARIRIICKQLKIIKVVQQEKLINCIFKDGDELAGQKIIDFVEKHRHQVRIRASKQPEIGIKYKKGDKLTVLVRKVLSSLKQIVTNK